MNGAELKLPDQYPGPVGNPDVIRTLEQALAAARAGGVSGVAVIMATGGDGVAVQIGGTGATALYTGCGKVQQDLLTALFNPKPGGLVIPRRM